jgi:predicted TIM-barrel fold metal-dependent hydrolase
MNYCMKEEDFRIQNRMKKDLPSDYLKLLYVDTVQNYQPTLQLAYDFFGPDRMLFATDYPYWSPQDAVASIEALDIPDDDKEKIWYRNAARLLKLEVGQASR